ncbi:DeoR/GlpR family DNA-binding transcription regulator [Mycetocola miduiensis]|uniref:Transcriptional regulator, DeoR family n=1 Tax=Mycetocola miduiensis TaxID=995034 RepID=A0A1I4YDU9_9MICO|nr:DeoR/GlpR family DNA-binding transcription regulator [Mycetocola miduiensis]SFN36215.1 transcriptional regulator, DeoR family [Mycetocola miduiensis]
MALRSTLSAEARRAGLLEDARTSGGVDLVDAATRYDVHPMTIRRDFEFLERDGHVRRVRGGVVTVDDDPFAMRQVRNLRAKQVIAAKVLPLIPSGGAIGLDASTTVCALAEMLPADRAITAVTNGLVAFDALSRKSAVQAYLTGGEREELNLSLVGHLTQQAFDTFHLDCSIISAMGVHARSGTSESTLAQAAVKDAMARAADRVILAVDASKLEFHSHVHALALERVTTLVTDLDPENGRLDPYRRLVPEIR